MTFPSNLFVSVTSVLIAQFFFTIFVWGESKVESTCSNVRVDPERRVWDCELLDACSDKLGFEAILALHQRLDDDANGNVDISESDDFLRDELNYENGYERQKGFHRNDKQITADELWLAWKSSEVHNWTVEETMQWLIVSVELPQYAKNFEENSVDGTALPRMAVNSMHFLSNLGIKDPIHKQKISLKAMDVVLFGPSKNHNYLKDAMLVLSLVIAVGGCWFALIQHKEAQSHLKKTMKDMESLQHAEESLLALQKELDKAKMEQEIVVTEKKNLERRLQNEITTVKQQDSLGSTDEQTRIQCLEEELKIVLDDLQNAEKALQEKSWIPSPALQHWLQLTYELELRHYNAKKLAAEQQLAAAKEGCEKLRKKRSSFLGTFRVAHGSSIDDVDNRILQAKAALSEVTKDLQERLHRWKQIEILCGFSVVHNPGLLQLQSILGTGMGGLVSSKSNLSSHLPRTSSEGTLAEEESPSGFGTGVSARSLVSIPFVCNQRQGASISTGGEHFTRRVPSDLKSCSSSSAILQRADALCCDYSDSYSTDGLDSDGFDDRSSIYSNHTITESSRPIFTVGESKEAVVKNPLSQRLNRRVPGFKATKLSELGFGSVDKILECAEYNTANSVPKPGALRPTTLSSTTINDTNSVILEEKRKVTHPTSQLQKAKTA